MYNLFMNALSFDLHKMKSNAIYLDGEDQYFTDKITNEIISLIPEEMKGFNVRQFDDINKNIDEIEEASKANSFFTSAMVLLIRDYNKTPSLTASNTKKLQSIIESLKGTDTYIVFDNTIKLTAAVLKLTEKIECSFTYKNKMELNKILTEESAGNIPMGILGRILEVCNYNIAQSITEVKKLLSYTNGGKVTMEVAEDLLTKPVDTQIFAIVDSITSNNKARALKVIEDLLASGTSISYIFSTLQGQYRNMLYTKITKLDNAELQKKLALRSIYPISIARRQAEQYSVIELKKIKDKLSEIELQIRSSVMSESMALDVLIASLMIA